MDLSNPVLSGLIRKRQEVADAIELAQTNLRQLILDMDALNGAIRLSSPTIDLDVVHVRPTPKRHVAFKGEISRLILTLLREAGEPLPTRELIRRSMEARGLNVADKGLYELMRERIGASLRGMRQRGRLVSSGGKGASVRWSVADAG